ncbi:hypothetical protein FPZ24_11455 [Sphingomonas panacisoli]|uniref:Uncharacterized protein n=1 Tax=Sphingomonas panacisoli TaxID=1813879 RepID=A0A5B8LKE4_9SPHN|nr:hypothetical protein [Sphingomonas panacisoli]QDZ08022.1 hypothetical protein FPZ24_11455 [Sphingomonas panacisoli]
MVGMTGFGVWKRASAWLAGAAMLPALAVAQTTPSGPQTDPSLDRFSLPPSTRPSPRPTPTSGPVIAPLNRPSPTPAAPIVVATPTPAPSAAATQPPARTPAPTATPARRPAEATGQPMRTPSPTPTSAPTSATAVSDTTPAPIPVASPTPEPTASVPATADQPSGGISTGLLVAIGAAALALVAFGGFLLGRRRSVREEEIAEPIVAQPAVAPPAPAATPEGAADIPVRRQFTDEPQPRLEINLIPKRAGTNLMGAAVDYRVVVRNTGTVAARDIRFAMYMLSASARQAQDLQMIFATPIEQPVVAPFDLAPDQEIDLSGMAMLAREQINVMTIDGKPWFVPVLAMKADYRWGENVGAPGVATAAHMIGIDRGEGAKMTPFRLDAGPHMHPEVAERKVA